MDMKSPPPYSEAAPYPSYPMASPPHPGYQQPIGFATASAPQPPPGYTTHSMVQPPTVIVQQPIMSPSTELRQNPVSVTCPHCHNHVVTKVIYTSGCLSWLLCGIMCFFGLWLGCCLIPFCVDGCKNAQHICPTCRRVIGYYAPL